MSTTSSTPPSPESGGSPAIFYLFIGLMALCLVGLVAYLLFS